MPKDMHIMGCVPKPQFYPVLTSALTDNFRQLIIHRLVYFIHPVDKKELQPRKLHKKRVLNQDNCL